MPWPSPPCTCPSTSIGFRIRPQSSTAMWRTSRTSPVSVSTSTTAMWVPNGKVEAGSRYTPSARKPGSIPAGSRARSAAADASSGQVIARVGAPATSRPPSPTVMSASSTSSR